MKLSDNVIKAEATLGVTAAGGGSYDDTELRERVEALEQKEDKDTVYDDTEIKAEIAEKQDKLTFDDAPTLNSSNPVTSGGVYSAIESQRGDYVTAGAAEGATIGQFGTAEGTPDSTKNIGFASHAEGTATKPSGEFAHSEGSSTTASGHSAHSEGYTTTASGNNSHSEGSGTTASGSCSHSEGTVTVASGLNSHSEGNFTVAASNNQHVFGNGNVEDAGNKYVEIVGNGNSSARSNARTLDWEGNEWIAGKYSQNGTPTERSDLATKAYVDDNAYDDTALSAEVYANTEALGGHTLGMDVPAGSKLTDTVYDDTAVREMIAGKQDTLTFDDTPTADSSNPVTSGGVKAYVDANTGGGGGELQLIDTITLTEDVSEIRYTLPSQYKHVVVEMKIAYNQSSSTAKQMWFFVNSFYMQDSNNSAIDIRNVYGNNYDNRFIIDIKCYQNVMHLLTTSTSGSGTNNVAGHILRSPKNYEDKAVSSIWMYVADKSLIDKSTEVRIYADNNL